MIGSYRISVVSTLFHSEDTIAEFVKLTCSNASKITDNFEIILIDDGSPDDSVKICRSLNAPIKIVSFNKNHGHSFISNSNKNVRNLQPLQNR